MKEINFSELCALVAKHKQPKTVRVILGGEDKGIWQWHHYKQDYDGAISTLTRRFNLTKLSTAKFQYQEPILDSMEKRYLKGILWPISIRSRVEYVKKYEAGEKYEYLHFGMKPHEEADAFILPLFPKGTMYRGMEHGKKYTLEELGL